MSDPEREAEGCTFDDVEFATTGPPAGHGPNLLDASPKGGHVFHVEDDYGLVVRILRIYAHTVTPMSGWAND